MILEVIRKKGVSLNVKRFKDFLKNTFENIGYKVSETSFKTGVRIGGEGEVFEYSFLLTCEKKIITKRNREWNYVVKINFKMTGIPETPWKREKLLGDVEIRIVGGFEHRKEDLTVHHNPLILILQRIFGIKPEKIYKKTGEDLKKEIREVKKKIEKILG